MFFCTAILVVCFGFLADDEKKLLSAGNLANGRVVEGFALLLLGIFILLVFSTDIFANLCPLNFLFLHEAGFSSQ